MAYDEIRRTDATRAKPHARRWGAAPEALTRYVGQSRSGPLLTVEARAMRLVVVVLLLCVWLYLAYREYQAGDMMMAGLFLLIGIALTVWRLRRA